MISFLHGTVAAKTATSVIIEVAGIGYEVAMSGRGLSRLGQAGDSVQILTHLQVRDDALVLYGFSSQAEKEVFSKLTSVSSVGPKVALSVLSTYDPEEVIAAIVAQDLAAIQRVPGVGKKMASRVVLELKDSFAASDQGALPGVSATSANAKKGAAEALLSMGFTSEETELALKGAPANEDEAGLLQYALRRLGK